MNNNTHHNHKQGFAGDETPSPAKLPLAKRLMRLALAALLVTGFIYLAPNLERLPGGVGETITIIRESGIDTGAWYYDDVEQCFEGMDFVRERRGLDHR